MCAKGLGAAVDLSLVPLGFEVEEGGDHKRLYFLSTRNHCRTNTNIGTVNNIMNCETMESRVSNTHTIGNLDVNERVLCG